MGGDQLLLSNPEVTLVATATRLRIQHNETNNESKAKQNKAIQIKAEQNGTVDRK